MIIILYKKYLQHLYCNISQCMVYFSIFCMFVTSHPTLILGNLVYVVYVCVYICTYIRTCVLYIIYLSLPLFSNTSKVPLKFINQLHFKCYKHSPSFLIILQLLTAVFVFLNSFLFIFLKAFPFRPFH